MAGRTLLASLCLLAGIPAKAEAPPKLEAALKSYANMDDLTAERQLRALIAARPSSHEAALAHIYLGLIAMEQHYDVDLARAEFRKASTLDPTAEMPLNAAPKARMIFLAVQQEVVSEPVVPSVVPKPAVAAKAEIGSSRLPAYLVGGASVATLATGVILGVISNQTYAQGQAATDANRQRSLASEVQTQRILADGFYGAALVTGVVAVVLFFVEGPSSQPAVGVAATPDGVRLAARF